MELNFNQDWRFRREGGAWENVTLPHDAMITEVRSADAPGGVNSGYFPGGKYEYEKRFTVTAPIAAERWRLFVRERRKMLS